jgi:uncharacterized FAD-dependent dehydrogenase
MIREIQLQVLPHQAENTEVLKELISKKLNIEFSEINHIEIVKRSIDARQRIIKINLRLNVFIQQEFKKKEEDFPIYKNVEGKEEVIIVGAGPAGMFAALKLIEKGKKPIIIERGKEVRDRRFDLAKLTKEHIVNEDSNYCFGEGGAGTFSDGKL